MMKTILIADDEPHILSLLKMMLEEKYKLFFASDGEEALKELRKHRPDLVLLDVMMPKVNGYEVCEKIKSDPKTRDLTVVMLSAKTQERDIMKGLKLGADYYLTKPFDPLQLQKQLEEMLK